MNSGTYQEALSCGGTLKVTKTSWEISYYFPGPDLRYNGESLTILGSQLGFYLEAYAENWEEYEVLKTSIPFGGEFSKVGKMGMTIRVGTYHPGVCIKSHHMPVNTRLQLDRQIACYTYARERAPKIQAFLLSST